MIIVFFSYDESKDGKFSYCVKKIHNSELKYLICVNWFLFGFANLGTEAVARNISKEEYHVLNIIKQLIFLKSTLKWCIKIILFSEKPNLNTTLPVS